MNDDLEVTREEYDPLNVEEHRVAPMTVPPLVAPTAGPGHAGSTDPEMVVASVPLEVAPPAEPVVPGRMEDRPHFLRVLPDGTERCGQCGKYWPCTEFLRTVQAVEASMAPAGELVDVASAAAAAGVSVEEFRARLAAQDRRYQ